MSISQSSTATPMRAIGIIRRYAISPRLGSHPNFRKDLGDVAALARSIEENGNLHPIVITPDGTLIAGERRLAALQHIGRQTVPVTVREPADILRAQLAENTMRKDFLPSETYEIFKSLLPEEQAAAKERMRKGGRVRKLSLPCDQTG